MVGRIFFAVVIGLAAWRTWKSLCFSSAALKQPTPHKPSSHSYWLLHPVGLSTAPYSHAPLTSSQQLRMFFRTCFQLFCSLHPATYPHCIHGKQVLLVFNLSSALHSRQFSYGFSSCHRLFSGYQLASSLALLAFRVARSYFQLPSRLVLRASAACSSLIDAFKLATLCLRRIFDLCILRAVVAF